MKKNIIFCLEEIEFRQKQLKSLCEMFQNHKKEWEAICGEELSEFPEKELNKLFEMKKLICKIHDNLEQNVEKLSHISDIYQRIEEENYAMVSSLSQKRKNIDDGQNMLSHKVSLEKWDECVPGKNIHSNQFLMDDWMYQHVLRWQIFSWQRIQE